MHTLTGVNTTKTRLSRKLGLEVGAATGEAMFAPPAGSRVSNAKGTGRLPVTNFFGIPATGPLGLLLRAAGRQA